MKEMSKNTSEKFFNLPFIVAVVVLGISWGGFKLMTNWLQMVTYKQPVLWPAGVTVNSEDFRMTSLPLEMGPFKRLEDGMLSGEKDGQPDGERILTEDILESLKIGTSLDESRVGDRQSNWYLSRIYVDTSKKSKQPFRYWLLDITYYTGGLEKVPHIPERCLTASGAQLLGSDSVVFSVDGLGAKYEDWQGGLKFRRTRYVRRDENMFREIKAAQFYLFSLNGNPESNWTTVRRQLSMPFGKYAYFAKIQFAPMDPTEDDQEILDETEKFVKQFLPYVVRTLPMPEDIKQLEKLQE